LLQRTEFDSFGRVTDRTQPRPLGERVLVKVLDEQEGTLQEMPHFGMMLMLTSDEPQQMKKRPKPARGVVVAVGPGSMVLVAASPDDPPVRQYVPCDVFPGDEVLFYSEPGIPVEVDGEELILVPEQAILVVLSGAPALAATHGPEVDDV
jgi:co-chaperonin GroES (HSP10)